METTQQTKGLFKTIGLLTLSLSSLVLFLWQGVALFMREAGHSSDIVGLLFLAGLPWILRFLWAPLIDRVEFFRLGHYRSWILATQIALVLGLSALVLIDIATMPFAIIFVLAALSAIMGTQQTAIFGLMAVQLAPEDRVRGMTVQTISYASASVFMGLGVLYMLSDLGWRPTVLAIVLGSIAFLIVLSPLKLDAGQKRTADGPGYISHLAVLRDPKVRRLLVATLLISAALAATYGLQSLMLIDAGLTVANASLVSIVGTGAVGMLGGIIAKPLTERVGAYRALAGIGAGLSVSCLSFGLALQSGLATPIVIALILINSFFFFALLPASKSILIGYCGTGREATDFAAYSGIEGLFFMLVTGLLASQADHLGYATIFVCAGICTFAGAVFAWSIRHDGMPAETGVVT